MFDRAELKKADDKFRRGDSLTDVECYALAKAYREAQQALWSIYNPAYTLVENDLNARANSLEGYVKARRERRA